LPTPTLFPYTTLFRSQAEIWIRRPAVGAQCHGTLQVEQRPPRMRRMAECRVSSRTIDQRHMRMLGQKTELALGEVISMYDQRMEDRKSTRLNSSHDQI